MFFREAWDDGEIVVPLETLKRLTPYEFIRKVWSSQPERFTSNPLRQSRD
jgi:hypothetical protein